MVHVMTLHLHLFLYIILNVCPSECGAQRGLVFGNTSLPRGRSLLVHAIHTPSDSTECSVNASSSGDWGKYVRFGMGQIYPHGYSNCSNRWEAYGRDAIFIKMIAMHINAPLCVNIPDILALPYNRWFTDIEVNGQSLYSGQSVYDWFEFLYPHAQSNMCVLIRKAKPLRRNIFQSFSANVWIVLLALLLFYTIAFRMIEQKNIETAILHSFQTFLTGGFTDNPKNVKMKYLQILQSTFGLLILSAISGCTLSFLTVGEEIRQLQTLEEIDALVDQVHMHPSWRNFDRLSDDVVTRLLKKDIYYSDYNEMLNKILDGSAATLAPEGRLKYYQLFPQMSDKNGRKLTHIVPECVLSPAYFSFSVRKGWPHIHKINAMVQWMVEGGLVDLYDSISWNIYKRYFGRRHPAIGDAEPPRRPEALTIDALVEAGAVWVTGICLGFIAFVIENIVYSRT